MQLSHFILLPRFSLFHVRLPATSVSDPVPLLCDHDGIVLVDAKHYPGASAVVFIDNEV